MVRPRLVEEGKPLTDEVEDQEEEEVDPDHGMEDAAVVVTSSSKWNHHHRQQQHHHPSHNNHNHNSMPETITKKKSPQHAPSSLMAAVGGSIPKFSSSKKKRSGRVVIGGEDAEVGVVNQASSDAVVWSSSSSLDNNTAGKEGRWSSTPTQQHHYHYHPQQQHDPSTNSSRPNNAMAYYPSSSGSPSFRKSNNDYQQNQHHHHNATSNHHHHHNALHYQPHRSHIEIGADERHTERMQGVVQDETGKAPLVVLDGANVAYAYADAIMMSSGDNHAGNGSGGVGDGTSRRNRIEPDARGIRVACQYFLNAGIRVLVVLPASYLRQKPRAHDHNSSNAAMQTEQMDVLYSLKQSGLLVASPPTDDDDAYALTIARRENQRRLLAFQKIQQQQQHGPSPLALAAGHAQSQPLPPLPPPAFVLSNDLFRDAQARDKTLKDWLIAGDSTGVGSGRISFAFVDMGRIDDYGDRELDVVPNPRHPLCIWVEERMLQHHQHPTHHL